MNYSKNVKRLAREITRHYARFNTIDDQYIIDIADIPDFDLHEIAALMMSEDKSLASEATGLDNPAYETKMLPALTKMLGNSTNSDEKIEFVNEWREGVTSYFTNMIDELLQDSVMEMNHDIGKLFSYSSRQKFNELRAES